MDAWDKLVDKCIEFCAEAGGKIIFALIVLVVGCLVIKTIKRMIKKLNKVSRLEKTVQTFLGHLTSVLLYLVLFISVIGILGIPMTSVVTVLASCGLAIGLSLQGALSNFAGGLMILIFKPFRVGDYIQASGAEGTVKDISVFYTSLTTVDNKRITVPNGDLMNANVTNFSCEDLRRIDMDFKITNDCSVKDAQAVLFTAAKGTLDVLPDPEPFTRLTSIDIDTYIFTVRVWCQSSKYWSVYMDLLENCCQALNDHGLDDPEKRLAVRIVKENAEKNGNIL